MKRVYILPYKNTSKSAKVLALSLNVLRIRNSPDSKWVWKGDKVVINWGCSEGTVPDNVPDLPFYMLNQPHYVSIASDKKRCLEKLKEWGVSTVPFTTSLVVVEDWLREDAIVYCRTQLNGHSGAGIVVAKVVKDLVPAHLFTKHLNAKSEWRVHVVNGHVIDVRRKAKKVGHEGNKYVRNHANGYVYKREDLDIPPTITSTSVAAITALSLDFGAVDILYYKGEGYVLEVNTAPGLVGSTVEAYAEAFGEML